MADAIREWLLQHLKANDSLDGVAVVVKLAVTEFGSKVVAHELREMAGQLERAGDVRGWKFPVDDGASKAKSRVRTAA